MFSVTHSSVRKLIRSYDGSKVFGNIGLTEESSDKVAELGIVFQSVQYDAIFRVWRYLHL